MEELNTITTTTKQVKPKTSTIMKRSIILAAASLMVMGCSKRVISPDAPVGPAADPNIVQFSSNVTSVAPGSKVVYNATDSKDVFEATDSIGIYAVMHGKVLPVANAFPSLPAFQFKDKSYKAKAYVTGAHNNEFSPNDWKDNTIYYQTGGAEWDFYAYYPKTLNVKPTNDLGTGGPSATYVSKGSADMNATSFTYQTDLFDVDVTGVVTNKAAGVPESPTGNAAPNAFPMMTAYQNAGAARPSTPTSVALPFKYDNAKITLNITLDEAVGYAEDILAIEFYNYKSVSDVDGLVSGYTFNLTRANISSATNVTPSQMVVQQDGTNGAALTGTLGTPTNYGLALLDRPSYRFQNLAKTVAAPTGTGVDGVVSTGVAVGVEGFVPNVLKSTAIGYLIPTVTLQQRIVSDGTTTETDFKNPEIRITVGDGAKRKAIAAGTSNAETTVSSTLAEHEKNKVFVAKLNVTTQIEGDGGTTTAAKNYLPYIAAGTHYIFDINVKQSGVSFVGTITDWSVVESPGAGIPAE